MKYLIVGFFFLLAIFSGFVTFIRAVNPDPEQAVLARGLMVTVGCLLVSIFLAFLLD